MSNPTNPIRAALDARRDETIDALRAGVEESARTPRELAGPTDPIARARLVERINAQLVDAVHLPGRIVLDADGVPDLVTEGTRYEVGELVPAEGVVWHFIEDENGNTRIVEEQL